MTDSQTHRRPQRSTLAAVLALAAGTLLASAPAGASAAAPPNDDRATPTVLDPPGAVRGTTVEATLEPDESNSIAGIPVDGTVWYQLSTRQARTAVIRLAADGELDAGIEVFRRARSQLVSESVSLTGENGRAELVTSLRAGAVYLIRVARRANSVAGGFRLEVFLPEGPPPAPGQPISGGVANGTIDPLVRTADTWSAVLREGVTYRIHLINRSSRRLQLNLFPPGTGSLRNASPVGSSRSYQLFTPGPGAGGRYSFLVSSSRLSARQVYQLRIGRAGKDDMWPGRELRNLRSVSGTVDRGGLDVVDVYRFDLASRSAVSVRLEPGPGTFNLALLRAGGGRVGSRPTAEGPVTLTRTLQPGRYVVVVRAGRGSAGSYTLRRQARTITRLRLSLAEDRLVPPGRDLTFGVRLAPDVSGRVAITIERFDPASGWHFARTVRIRVVDGRGAATFRPPDIGRWRARAAFAGTRTAEPSQTRNDVNWTVAEPLDP